MFVTNAQPTNTITHLLLCANHAPLDLVAAPIMEVLLVYVVVFLDILLILII